MKTDYYKSARETTAEFNARMDAEDKEAAKIPCPLDSCGAVAGEHCCTEAGQPRMRHCRRLMLARKEFPEV